MLVTSIIIASHRVDYISGVLIPLCEAAPGTGLYEIIVVTDYPNGQFQIKYPMVKWFYTNNKSISVKRNIGIKQARGELIAFIDDDCIPDLQWVNEGTTYLRIHRDCAGVEGFTSIEKSSQISPSNINYKRLEKPGFRTNNIFYKKTIIEEIGGFDERFSVQREDMDLAFRILKKGFKIDYSTAIRVVHRLRKGEWYDHLKSCWNRRFDPLLYRKHRKLYRKHICSPFPPSLLLLFIGYILIILTWDYPVLFKCTVFSSMSVLSGSVIKRVSKARKRIVLILREVLILLIAPIVLFVALFYGNIRYRSFLFV